MNSFLSKKSRIFLLVLFENLLSPSSQVKLISNSFPSIFPFPNVVSKTKGLMSFESFKFPNL